MPSPTVHYLWVGPKPEGENAGQDTVGPDLLRQKYPTHAQAIVFWCLDTEVEKYKAYFAETHKGRAPIEVKGIESYANSKGAIPFRRIMNEEMIEVDLKELFMDLINKLKERATLFQDDKVAQIQEWITIKDAFSFFLQLSEEGYIADSNIIPKPYDELSSKPLDNLVNLNGFHSAFLPAGKTQYRLRPDPWLMFCEKGDEKAFERFNKYVSQVHDYLDSCINEEDQQCPQDAKSIPDEQDKERSLREMIASMFEYTVKEDASKIEAYPSTSHAKYNNTYETSANMVKRYNNTHHRSKKPPLLETLLVGIESPQEFYHFAKNQVFDPFAPIECHSINILSIQDKSKLKALEEQIEDLEQEIYELKARKRDEPESFTQSDALSIKQLESTHDATMAAHGAEESRLKNELLTLFPQPTTMIKIAILLNKYHDLATMLALSHDPQVVPTLLMAPKE